MPRDRFQGVETLEVGMQFQASTDQGPVSVRVVKVEEDNVTVDGNHPLAGKHLNFNVTVQDVCEATEEELAHGHIHQGGGCCGGGGGEGECCSSEEGKGEGECCNDDKEQQGGCGCSH